MCKEKLITAIFSLIEDVTYLAESKSIASHMGIKGKDVRSIVGDIITSVDPTYLAKAKHNSLATALRNFKKIQDDFNLTLLNQISKFKAGDWTKGKFRVEAKSLFRDMYRRSLGWGMYGTGINTAMGRKKPGTALPDLTPVDEKWVESVLRDEAKYFNKFIDDIATGKVGTGRKMQLHDRVKMYANTLKMAFETGKVIPIPGNVLIYWLMNKAAEHCKTCLFLAENSPYTKLNLPTVPKSGDMDCLSNCKCRLIVRYVNEEKFKRVNDKAPTREQLRWKINRL